MGAGGRSVLTWPAKDPDEVLDYDVVWTDRLEDGEAILTSEFSVVSGTVTINTVQTGVGFSGTVAKVWLQGGAAGEACVILNRMTTDNTPARIHDQSIKLRIRNK
jgi:hypothetical protein